MEAIRRNIELKCDYVKYFTDMIRSEVSYLSKRLKSGNLNPEDEIGFRRHVFSLINNYLGLWIRPGGVCTYISTEADDKLRKKNSLDCKNCEVRKEYFDLIKIYKETHEK